MEIFLFLIKTKNRLNVGHLGCLPVRASAQHRHLCLALNHVIRLRATVDRKRQRIWNEAIQQFLPFWLVMIPAASDRLLSLNNRRRNNNNRLVTSWVVAIHFSLDAELKMELHSRPDLWPALFLLAVHRNKPRKVLSAVAGLTTVKIR